MNLHQTSHLLQSKLIRADTQGKKVYLGAITVLFLSALILVVLYGFSKKHAPDAGLEWECTHTQLHGFLSRQDLYQYDQARLYCDELTLDGRDDWRLPSDTELISFSSKVQAQNEMSTLTSRAATCWSSTPYHDSLLRYWAVSVSNKQAAPLSKDTYNAVICVRDTQK